jgi:putative ATP-dependent endonuclease of OLD family
LELGANSALLAREEFNVKIRKLAIKNVTSYRERTEFLFDNRLNILIGPNGGGKTNLQKIIALTLSRYLIHQYQFRRDDNAVSVEVADPWTQRGRLQQAFSKFVGDESEQLIEIELAPERRDIENIKTIGENLEKFNKELSYWEKRYDTYDPLPFAGMIGQAESFTFVIRNLVFEEPPAQTPAWAFREYLREFFIFLRVANHIPDVTLSSPVFFFSADRALGRNFEVQAGQLTEQAYFDGYRSAYQAAMGESMNLMQWGTQHFVRLHRRAVNEASSISDKTWPDFFRQFSDVQLLDRYLEQLGYKWGFDTDMDQLTYRFVLAKDGDKFYANMFSSGEREIVHFLLAMFALNVQDGLVLVDEPELHLHPRWQKIFLNLFRGLAPERNNQFIITTHSPTFVSPETIDSVTRVYRSSATGSAQVALRDVDLPAKKSLVRMINSQNNERLFFADKVVLVEGISDRLVFETLLDSVSARFNIGTAIEIIEVGGKHNFADYSTILDGLLTPTFTVADRDYLTIVGSGETRSLFVADYEKQWKTLAEGKKSIDRASMISHLNTAIASGDLGKLREFWNYFVNRLKRLMDPMSDKENAILNADFDRLKADNIFVLREGEIEDYLPPGERDVRSIVELVSDRHWINKVANAKARVELGEIICSVVGIVADEREKFLGELRSAAVTFPTSIAGGPPATGA